MTPVQNTILIGIFLCCMALIVCTGCTVITSDDPEWRWPSDLELER